MEELKEEKRKGHIKSKTIKRVLSCPVERWVLCICGPPVCTEHSNLSRCDGNDPQTLGSCDP